VTEPPLLQANRLSSCRRSKPSLAQKSIRTTSWARGWFPSNMCEYRIAIGAPKEARQLVFGVVQYRRIGFSIIGLHGSECRFADGFRLRALSPTCVSACRVDGYVRHNCPSVYNFSPCQPINSAAKRGSVRRVTELASEQLSVGQSLWPAWIAVRPPAVSSTRQCALNAGEQSATPARTSTAAWRTRRTRPAPTRRSVPLESWRDEAAPKNSCRSRPGPARIVAMSALQRR
jgi:hypothetical protein